jgi:hypothetical protein
MDLSTSAAVLVGALMICFCLLGGERRRAAQLLAMHEAAMQKADFIHGSIAALDYRAADSFEAFKAERRRADRGGSNDPDGASRPQPVARP